MKPCFLEKGKEKARKKKMHLEKLTQIELHLSGRSEIKHHESSV